MEVTQFERLFDNHILERGMLYAQDKVHHFVDDGHTIGAIVYGRDHYHVEVKTDGAHILSMTCDCPYAREGHACKHEAAVLYVQREASQAKRQEKLRNDIDLVFQQRTDEDLLAFFRQELLSDQTLYRHFEERFISRLTKEDLRGFQNVLERIMMRYEKDDRVDRLIDECDVFLTQHIMQMINEGYDNEAFTLMCMMIDELSRHTQTLVEAHGTLFKTRLVKALTLVIARSSGLVEARMYRYVAGYYGRISWISQDMATLFYDYFPTYACKKVVQMQEQVTNMLSSSYDLDQKRALLKVYLQLLEEAGQTEELQAFCEQYFADRCVRDAYSAYLTEKGKISQYRSLLEKALRQETSNAVLRDIAYELKDLYRQDDPERYKALLRDILTRYDPCDFQTYLLYKGLFSPDAWAAERQALIAQLRHYRGIDKIYEHEGMMDELVRYLSEHPSTTLLQEYAEIVRSYPQLLLRQYEERIETMALPVSDRATYRQIAMMMRQMRQVPGGEERAERLLARLKDTYKNRTAMMAELRKV